MTAFDPLSGFLEANRKLFEEGNQWSLMQAIHACVEDGRALPDWAAKAFIAAYEKIERAEFKSWDSVFGVPYKGRQLAAVRKQKKKLNPLICRIREIRRDAPNTRIDDALFERVGKELGLGTTLAKKYYYDAINAFGAWVVEP